MDRAMIDTRVLATSRRDASALRRLITWFRNEYRIRRTINELTELDNDMLSDIGLTRGEIEHATRYGRYREQATVAKDVADPNAGRSCATPCRHTRSERIRGANRNRLRAQ